MEHTEDISAGCYNCGSFEGSLLKLCPDCIAENDSARARLKERLKINTDASEDPIVYKVVMSPLYQLAGIAVLEVIAATIMVGLCCSIHVKVSTALTLTAAIVSSSFYLLTWLMIWVNIIMFDTPRGIACLIFPGWVYRHIWYLFMHRKSDDRWQMYKSVFMTNLIALGLGFLTAMVLASTSPADLRTASFKLEKYYGISLSRLTFGKIDNYM